MKELTEQDLKDHLIRRLDDFVNPPKGGVTTMPMSMPLNGNEAIIVLSLLSKDQPVVGAEELKRECPECVGRDMPPSGVTKEGEVMDCNTCNGNGYINYFRVQYSKGMEGGIVPTVWLGNQGFELRESLHFEGEMTAKDHAKWYIKMFKTAINKFAEAYAAHERENMLDVSDEEIEEICHKKGYSGYSTVWIAWMKEGAKALLNHLKQGE